MKVLKFGGTSVGSPESILNVKKIVEAQTEPVVVVVSALGGITDKLIATSQLAVAGDAKYLDSYYEMVLRHHDMIEKVIGTTATKIALLKEIDNLLEDLKSIYQGVYLIRDLSEKTQNAIVSYGERMSSRIC
ncbi:MAG: bifunctional aspartate kinase/homoserine dehydrogenase I, partial [Bacteroidaceae bacterium]|nr:bifunctional aspartate kinase/homoserine dehydrogenase I [Bacteroidaceae bacterium]